MFLHMSDSYQSTDIWHHHFNYNFVMCRVLHKKIQNLYNKILLSQYKAQGLDVKIL